MPETDLVAQIERGVALVGTPVSGIPSATRLVWPTNSRLITQAPHEGHVAIDIAATNNSPIRAVLPGRIERTVSNHPIYGNFVIVRLASGVEAMYAHLNAFTVRPGQVVSGGQAVGLAGSTGRSTGPHLHLEFRDPNTGRAIPPERILGRSPDFAALPPTQFGMVTATERAIASQMRAALPAAAATVELTSPAIPGQPGRWVQAAPAVTSLAENLFGLPLSPAPPEEGSIRVLTTPLGDVALPPLPWLRIGVVTLGLVLLVIGILAALRPVRDVALREAGKVARAAIAGG